ncbi:MAG: virulence factor [Anaerolineae bacterium]
MAEYRILYWKDIPYGVRATDGDQRMTRKLPSVFEATVDAAAMVEGATEEEAYRAGFHWGPVQQRDGDPETVADAVVEELQQAYPQERLGRLARREA